MISEIGNIVADFVNDSIPLHCNWIKVSIRDDGVNLSYDVYDGFNRYVCLSRRDYRCAPSGSLSESGSLSAVPLP
jgi:hypothetical protein